MTDHSKISAAYRNYERSIEWKLCNVYAILIYSTKHYVKHSKKFQRSIATGVKTVWNARNMPNFIQWHENVSLLNQACITLMAALAAIAQQHSNRQLIESWMWPWFCHLRCNDKIIKLNHQFHSIVCCAWQYWEILGRLSYLEILYAKLACILLFNYTVVSRCSCHATTHACNSYVSQVMALK
jgi:hypothetical protein